MIKSRYNDPNLKVIMVGDGATDLEASPPATHFIGEKGEEIEVMNMDFNFEPVIAFRLWRKYCTTRGPEPFNVLCHRLPGADGTDRLIHGFF